MNTLSSSAVTFAQAFSFALLSSLWQGALLAGVLFLSLRVFKNLCAQNRYVLSFASLVALVVWFAHTFITQYYALSSVVHVAASSSATPGAKHVYTTYLSAAGAGRTLFGGFFSSIVSNMSLILSLYAAGLMVMLVRFVVNLRRLHHFRSRDIVPAPPQLIAFVNAQAAVLNISRGVRLFVSQRVMVPVVSGVLKPVILLPVAAVNDLTTAELQTILLHELAHIRRNDYLHNLIQVTTETILFFNPFVWLVSARIRRERELCCDDMVMAATGDSLCYARALAALEEGRVEAGGLSLAANSDQLELLNRIKRIMTMKQQDVVQGRTTAVVFSVFAAALIAAMVSFTPSFAQKAEGAKTVKKKVSTKTLTVDSTGKKNVVTKTKTTTVASTADDAEDVDINISVSGEDKNRRSVTRVRVVAGDEQGSGTAKKKVIKTIDIQGDPADANLDAELAKAKRELEKVDWDQVKAEIVDAFKELDRELNLDALAKEINVEIKRELENSKKALKEASVQVERYRKDNELAKADIQRNLENSKRALKEATAEVDRHIKGRENAEANERIRKQMTVEKRGAAPADSDADMDVVHGPDMHEMLNKMDKGGLIDKSGRFRIEKSGDQLFINGAKQPAAVMKQYGKYLSAKEVKIKGIKGDLSIYIND
jgi:beta-lactamase regulating signal transducer with metallopeptidase domain